MVLWILLSLLAASVLLVIVVGMCMRFEDHQVQCTSPDRTTCMLCLSEQAVRRPKTVASTISRPLFVIAILAYGVWLFVITVCGAFVLAFETFVRLAR